MNNQNRCVSLSVPKNFHLCIVLQAICIVYRFINCYQSLIIKITLFGSGNLVHKCSSYQRSISE